MTRRAEKLQRPPSADPDDVILPRNLEAERAVLGAAMLKLSSADYIADKLTPASFFRRAHQQLFEVVRDLRHRSVSVDLIPVQDELNRRKQLTDVGGPAYITGLVDGVPQSTNLPHYVEILKDLETKRALYAFARQTLDLIADDSHRSGVILEDTDRRLTELQAGHVDGRMISLGSSVSRIMDDLDWLVAHKGELLGLPTGFKSLDDLTLGWQPGDMTVIGARPSIGKTTLVLNNAVAAGQALVAAGRTEVVAIFSFEMRRKQLEYRILSSLSGVPLSRILTGYFTDSDYAKFSEAIEHMRNLPIEIDDQAGQTRWQIRSACRRLKASKGLALIVIDYAQLIPGSLERRGASRNEELTDISRGLKELADEVSAPVILLSQLSRGSAKDVDRRPTLKDLRDCGALEQDADIVGLLHRRNHREGGPTALIVEKQRQGATGTVMLTLDRDIVTFSDGGDEPEEAPKSEPKKKVHRIG